MGHRRRTKRIKRAYLKRFSQAYINTGKGPNPVILAEYKDRARHIDLTLAQLLGLDKCKENGPRLAALKRAEEIRGATPARNYISVESGKVIRTLMFYSSESVFFVRNLIPLGKLQRSIHYPNRDVALDRWRRKKVSWVEVFSYIPPDSEPPSAP